MGLQDLLVKGLIELELKGKGPEEAKAALAQIVERSKKAAAEIKHLGDEGPKAAQKLGTIETSVGRIGSAIAGAFAVGTVANFVKNSIFQFAALERKWIAVREQLGNLGAQDKLGDVQKMLEALGFEKLQQTIPAFQRLLTITGDVQAAISGVTLATNLSERGFGEITATTDGLVQIMQGRAIGAANNFGIKLGKLNDFGKDNAAIMKELIAKYGDLSGSAEDTQEHIDTLSGAFDRLGASVGKLFSPVVSLMSNIAVGVVNFAEAITSGVNSVLSLPGQIKERMGAGLVGTIFGTAKDLGAEGQNAGLSYVAGLDSIVKQAEDKRKVAEDEARKEREDKDAKSAAERAEKEIEELKRVTDAYQAEAYRMVEIDRKAQAERTQETIDATRQRLEAEADATEEGTRARIDAELALFDYNAAEALRKIEGNNEAKKQLEIAFQIAREEIVRKGNESVETADVESLAKRVEAQKKYDSVIAQLEAELAAFKVNQATEVFAALADAARTEFGRHKGAARASVILDTAAAIMSIWAGSGPWYIKAIKTAAVAHAGRMQLEAINSATYDGGGGISSAGTGGAGGSQANAAPTDTSMSNMGIVSSTSSGSLKSGSFDDPINDRMAFAMGRRSAFDLASHFSRGFATGARDIVGGPTTYDQSDRRTITVNVQGLYGGRRGLQDLRRELARAEERDRARRLG